MFGCPNYPTVRGPVSQSRYVQVHRAGLVALLINALSPLVKDEETTLELYQSCGVLRNASCRRLDQVSNSLCLVPSYRRIFMTEQGYLGLSYPRIMEGDSELWLYDVNMSFVLRLKVSN